MIRAVLFDRDGTLIVDAHARAGRVVAMPHAACAIRRLRARSMRVGVVTNQPALARGEVTRQALQRMHDRIDAAIGPFDGWFVCPHDADARCACRKPRPGLIRQAAQAFGLLPAQCAVVGDIGCDVEAAAAAGARAVLVPTDVTLECEIAAAPVVCADLDRAVDWILA